MKYPFKGNEPCTQIDPEMFHPGTSPERRHIVALRKVCAECDLLIECGEYAIAENMIGFWGGMTENERRRVKRGRRENSNVR